MSFEMSDEEMEVYDPEDDTGYKNERVELSDEQLLKNIQTIQSQNNIKLSPELVKDLGNAVLTLKWRREPGRLMCISRQCSS